MKELDRRQRTNRLRDYTPYERQIEFHHKAERERLFMAGNQLGKSVAGAAEAAMHLTGQYPEWWEGWRFDKSIVMLAGSESYELTRDAAQRLLMGPPANEEDWGTGYIPKASIVRTTRRMGVSNALDSVTVKHVSGGTSTLLFKAYEQGRSKWQANTVDYVWFDEEPPEPVYFEGITRTNATGGRIAMTFTPLKGVSAVVRRYLEDDAPDRSTTTMTIHDAPHYSDEDRKRIIASYPPHEREARTSGVPTLGAGAIYPIAMSEIECAPFDIPAYWPRAFALDVGWKKTAALWFAIDRETDTLYAYSEYYQGQKVPALHARAIKARGAWIPGVIDPAANGSSQADGTKLKRLYQNEGLTLKNADNAVEAGIYEVWQRMETGRLKVFSTLVNLKSELRYYRRGENGKIVKENDHLVDVLRYGCVSGVKVAAIRQIEHDTRTSAYSVGDRKAGW